MEMNFTIYDLTVFYLGSIFCGFLTALIFGLFIDLWISKERS